MTITTPDAYVSSTSRWVHSTFMVSITNAPNGYETYAQMLNEVYKDELNSGDSAKATVSADMQKLMSAISDGDGGLSPAYFSRRKCRDTTLGGNDAINPYWQYCENDDIAHPFNLVKINGLIGMGRVYSETIDDLQRILYLGFGVYKFNNLSGFYANAYDQNMGDLMNKGADGIDIANIIGQLTGWTARAIIKVPQWPLEMIRYLLSSASRTPVTKYFDFKSEMPLYYRLANTITIQLAINLGLITNTFTSNPTSTTGSNISDKTHAQLAADINAEVGEQRGAPDYAALDNFDAFKILMKKALYDNAELGSTIFSTDQALRAQSSLSTDGATTGGTTTGVNTDGTNSVASIVRSTINAFTTAYGASLHQAMMFVGFRIERGSQASESLSTSTGPSPVQQAINSKMQSSRQAQFAMMGGKLGDGAVAGAIQGFFGLAASAAEGFAQGFGLAGLSALTTGAAMIDIPEVWQDSNFTKSYSFNMKLSAPYGDPMTIMQTEYFPLALLLAGALPRATGASSYTSPFLCRAYCKGMFAVPLGIIDSLSIDRGSSTHGWNHASLPLSLDINFSIKDLSPSMIIAMGGDRLTTMLSELAGGNTPFNQYLMTLSGMGPLEFINPATNTQRRFAILLQSVKENKLNPTMWGSVFGSKSPVKFIYNFLPETSLLPR